MRCVCGRCSGLIVVQRKETDDLFGIGAFLTDAKQGKKVGALRDVPCCDPCRRSTRLDSAVRWGPVHPARSRAVRTVSG